jgi:hypothetical protein
MPPSIKADCSVADSTAILNSWLNGLPSGSSVQFPANGCFHIQGSLWLYNTTDLTINGNDSTILQTVPGPESVVQPIVYLTQDTQLVMKDLTIDGAYNGSNGGVNFEGDYGLLLEADHGVTLNDISVNNIQVDFIDLNAPDSGVTGSDTSLNSDIFVTHSTFQHCGYHGLTIESADGVAFSHDAFSEIGTDAMDFEYDVYSTTFDAQGNPQEAAQDNIRIIDDTWNDFGDDWFASLQGQVPGVQEQNVMLSGNTINAQSPLVEIGGTNPYLTSSQYWNIGLTIADNTGLQGAIPIRGGSITTPFAGSAMSIEAVVNANIRANTFPMFDGTPDYFPNTPYLAVLQALELKNLTMTGNNFSGALGILDPTSLANTNLVEHGNLYGTNGAQSDSG